MMSFVLKDFVEVEQHTSAKNMIFVFMSIQCIKGCTMMGLY